MAGNYMEICSIALPASEANPFDLRKLCDGKMGETVVSFMRDASLPTSSHVAYLLNVLVTLIHCEHKVDVYFAAQFGLAESCLGATLDKLEEWMKNTRWMKLWNYIERWWWCNEYDKWMKSVRHARSANLRGLICPMKMGLIGLRNNINRHFIHVSLTYMKTTFYNGNYCTGRPRTGPKNSFSFMYLWKASVAHENFVPVNCF